MHFVHGVGYNDRKYPSSINDVEIKESLLWRSMLQRCYDKNALSRRPTYQGCTVSENFKSYSYFYEWCQKQIGFGLDDFHLEKDLLIKGNKEYSEDNCFFVPRRINAAIVNKKSTRGDYPIGVYWNKINKNFVARCTVDGKTKHIGSFSDPLSAFKAYKTFKETYLKNLAIEYKDVIDIRVYDALINYTVEITD